MKMLTADIHCTRSCGTQCNRCSTACPADAISFASAESAPVINDEACTKCGICMGVCDAFTSDATTTLALYEHLRKVAMRGELVYVTCKENIFPGFKPAKNVTVLPCIACMPPELWALLLAQNIPVCLACDFKYCEGCSRGGDVGQMLFARSIELAEQWTGGEVRWDREIPEFVEEAAPQDPRYGRREAFDNVKGDAFDILSGKRRLKNSDTLKDVYRNKERARMQSMLNLSDGEILNSFTKSGRSSMVMPPRRKMLLEAMLSKPDMMTNVDMIVSETDAALCCANCTDCTTHCPSGARSVSPKNGTLAYDMRYCIGCGMCVDDCTRDAITLYQMTADQAMPKGPGSADNLQ